MHAKEGGARGLGHVAARGLQVGAGLFFQRQGFLHAVLHRKSGKQRQIEGHAHAGAVGAVVHAGRRDGAVRVARDVVAHLQVQGGQVAGFGLLGFKAGNVQRDGGLAHAGLLVACSVHPGGHVVGLHRGQLHGQRQRLGLGAGDAHQLVQCQAFHAQVVFGRDFLGHHQVVAGLGLARIGDGGGAHLEVALGGGQLLRHGGFLRLHEGQGVLRGQHVKVGLAHAHQQVLRGGVQLRLGHVNAALALLQRDAVGGAVQRLRGLHAHRLRGAGVLHRRAAQFHIGAAEPGRERGAGQQAGAGLVGAAGCCVELGSGRLPGRVIGACRFHQLQQALGVRRGAQRRAERQGQK
ncbi:hypothetical protein D3C71_1275380 [compost metagenome]